MNTYTYIDNDSQQIKQSCYRNKCAMAACRKIFNKILREKRDSIKTHYVQNITIIDLKTMKRYYYKCMAVKLDTPIVKTMKNGRVLFINYNCQFMKYPGPY